MEALLGEPRFATRDPQQRAAYVRETRSHGVRLPDGARRVRTYGASQMAHPRTTTQRHPMSTILIGVDASPRSEDAIAFGTPARRRLERPRRRRQRLPLQRRDPPGLQPGIPRRRSATTRSTPPGDARPARRHRSGPPAAPDHGQPVARPRPARPRRGGARRAGRRRLLAHRPARTRGAGQHRPSGCCTARRAPSRSSRTATAPAPSSRSAGSASAYDGSDESTAALAAAVELARAFSAELEVIGVVAPEIYARSGMMGAASTSSRPRTSRAPCRTASTPSSPGSRRASPPGACAWRATRPTSSAAHSAGLDLMLAGSRGYGPLRSVLVGGVSGRLMRTVHCPVIVIPRGVERHFRRCSPPRRPARSEHGPHPQGPDRTAPRRP